MRINALWTVLALMACGPAWGGLRSPMGEVEINNVPLGETINLRELGSIPYSVANTGLAPVRVELSVVGRDPDEFVKPGFEKIPDLGWIRLTRTEFRLAPGQEGVSDVFVSIPNDERHLGKKYQAYLWARTVPDEERPGVQVSAGLKSRLLLTVAPTPYTTAQRKKIRELKAALGFQLIPDQLRLSASPGEAFDIKKRHKKAFKLINPNDAALRFKVRVIARNNSYVRLPEGWEDPPEGTRWLSAGPADLVVEANAISEIALNLALPDDAALAGGRFLFVVRAEIQDSDVPVGYHGRVFVEVVKNQEKE